MSTLMKKSKEWKPTDLGLENMNMKAANGTKYATPVMNLEDYSSFLVHLSTNNTGGGAAGVASMQVILYGSDGSTVLQTIDLFTALATTADSEVTVEFGRAIDGILTGGGTIGTNINALRMLRLAKFQVTVGTASDATTCVSTLRVQAQV